VVLVLFIMVCRNNSLVQAFKTVRAVLFAILAFCSISATTMRGVLMKTLSVGVAKKTYPTGDPSFAVMQAFPAAVRTQRGD
jgi:hypothetical protein